MNTSAFRRRIFSLFLPILFASAGIAHAAPPLVPNPSREVPKTNPSATKGDGQITALSIVPADHPWYTGANVNIKWEWPGYVGFPAEVTLWQGSTLMATIDPRQTKLNTGWVVPSNFKPGTYMIKVKSFGNSANHTEKQVDIIKSTLAIIKPTTEAKNNVKFPIKWQFVGNVGSTADIIITTATSDMTSAGSKTQPVTEVLHIKNFSMGDNGKGGYNEWVPSSTYDMFEQYYLITVQSTKYPDIKSDYKVRVKGSFTLPTPAPPPTNNNNPPLPGPH